jgi:hypothetical protein
MPVSAAIAVASRRPGELGTVVEWLSEAGYTPVPMPDLTGLGELLQSKPVEALVADVEVIGGDADIRNLIRRLGHNRPLVVMGDSNALPRTQLGELSVLARPLKRDALLLSVGLALAEGRPARRFPRRSVEPIQATAQGITVTIREASVGGVGLDVSGSRTNVLPPYFSLRIPDVGVHVVVKRAWMAPLSSDRMRCGGTVEGDLPDAGQAWVQFVREAPDPLPQFGRKRRR